MLGGSVSMTANQPIGFVTPAEIADNAVCAAFVTLSPWIHSNELLLAQNAETHQDSVPQGSSGEIFAQIGVMDPLHQPQLAFSLARSFLHGGSGTVLYSIIPSISSESASAHPSSQLLASFYQKFLAIYRAVQEELQAQTQGPGSHRVSDSILDAGLAGALRNSILESLRGTNAQRHPRTVSFFVLFLNLFLSVISLCIVLITMIF